MRREDSASRREDRRRARVHDGRMANTSRAATGAHTTDGVPHGRTSLTPHLVVSPADSAIDFYRDALGATVRSVTRMQGLVGEAELAFANGTLTLGDPLPAYGLVPPTPENGASFSLALYVSDVDAVVERAVAAGATLREPATDFVSGDRYASILDPFGVRWSIMTRVEDLSPEESEQRVQQWAAGLAES